MIFKVLSGNKFFIFYLNGDRNILVLLRIDYFYSLGVVMINIYRGDFIQDVFYGGVKFMVIQIGVDVFRFYNGY